MFEWHMSNDGSAHARTTFAQFRVFPDFRHSKEYVVCYEARVETTNGEALSTQHSFATMPDAKRWCEEEYARLLRDALRSIAAVDAVAIALHNVRLWLAAREIADTPSIVTKQVMLDAIDHALAR